MKEQWGKLTDDDLDVINGRRDQLEGKIQERYGIAKDQVRNDVDSWLRSMPLRDFVQESPGATLWPGLLTRNPATPLLSRRFSLVGPHTTAS